MYFQYSEPGQDQKDNAAVLQEELKNEKAARKLRKSAARRAQGNARSKPSSGWLSPETPPFKIFAGLRRDIHAAVVVAIERFKHLQDEVRINCQYDILSPGRLGVYTTLPNGSPQGCAAGSVLQVSWSVKG